MYCPLCKAEYRTGFDKCSDCHTGLVPTREQADAMQVVRLWKGTSQSKFNDIVAALQDANVPNLAKSGVSAEPLPTWAHLPIISWFLGMKRFHDQMSWEVFVLRSDYDRWRGVVEKG
jgi:hypothetical protein